MLIDLYEKGRSREELTRGEYTLKTSCLIGSLGCSAIFFSVLLLLYGVFTLNKYIFCISLAVLVSLFTPINTKRINLSRLNTFSRLKLNIEKYYNRTASVKLAELFLLSVFMFDFSDDDLELKIMFGIVFLFVYLLAVYLLKKLLYILFRKRAVERRRERCVLAIIANYVGEAVNHKLLDSYEQASDRFKKYSDISSALYNRNQYCYTYNGSEYHILDHGENPTNDDKTVYIDPSAPEYYYDEKWER